MKIQKQLGIAPIVIILIAIGVMVLVGGVWYWQKLTDNHSQQSPSPSPQPTIQDEDETTGWQTYRNEDLGFEIKYPLDWLVDEEYKQEGLVSFLTQARQKRLESIPDPEYMLLCDFIIKVYESSKNLPNNKKNLSFEEWIDSDEGKDFFRIRDEWLPVEIGGGVGYSGYTSWEFIRYYIILIENQGKIYKITAHFEEESRGSGFFEEESLKKKIISTFKFIN